MRNEWRRQRSEIVDWAGAWVSRGSPEALGGRGPGARWRGRRDPTHDDSDFYVVFAHGDVNYRPRVYCLTPDAVHKPEPEADFSTTRRTPRKHDTEMVLGAEVQYPGFRRESSAR